MDQLLQDIRYGLRILFRAPGFTLIAVLTLGIGIGVNIAVFSIVYGVLLRPLPYHDPDRLVQVYTANPARLADHGPFSPQDLDDFRRQQSVFQNVGSYWYSSASSGKTLTGSGNPRHLETAYADSGFFTTLAVAPALGRTFLPTEDVHGNDAVAVLSDHMWRQQFESDKSVVGRTISLDGEQYVIAGVMPPSFTYPSPGVDLWVPLAQLTDKQIPHIRQLRWIDVIGRRRPDVSLAQAANASSIIMRQLEQQYPETNQGAGAGMVQELRHSVVGEVRPVLLALVGAVALVLLITCANVANLLFARGTTRVREIAIRTALGARPARLRRQLLTESALLGLLGGVASFLFAAWSNSALLLLSANTIPRPDEIRMDGPVIIFGFVLSIVTGLLIGAIPALRLTVSRTWEAVKSAGPTTTTGARHLRGRDALVVSEIVVACVLLACSSLVLKSLWKLVNTDPGFDARHVLTVQLPLPLYKYDTPEKQHAYRSELLRRVRALPGVSSAGGSKTLPLDSGGEPYRFTAKDADGQILNINPTAGAFIVTDGYFEALKIPVISGRVFNSADLAEHHLVAIVSRTLAQTYWPGQDPVGKYLDMGRAKLEVIGVVGDVHTEGLNMPSGTALYIPSSLAPRAKFDLFVRTSGDPLAFADAVRHTIQDVEPQQAITEISPLQQHLQETVARPRFFTIVLSTFGLIALLLAVLGIFGVISYAVRQRTREFGIRIALGASRRDVLGLVLRRAAKLLIAGASLGVVGAVLSGRFLASLLFDVRPADPEAIAGAVIVLSIAALSAAAIPALRASRIEPVTALREE